jgi:sporulation protein YabP
MNNSASVSQNVLMFNRSRVELDGIIDVESFTDQYVIAESALGKISLDGEELKIESFSAEMGKLVVNGKFDSIYYFGNRTSKRSRSSSKKGGK